MDLTNVDLNCKDFLPINGNTDHLIYAIMIKPNMIGLIQQLKTSIVINFVLVIIFTINNRAIIIGQYSTFSEILFQIFCTIERILLG